MLAALSIYLLTDLGIFQAQNAREEGNALREENVMLKMENFETREMLKDEFCSRCKGISNEVSDHILELLQIEKSQLIDKVRSLSLPPSLCYWALFYLRQFFSYDVELSFTHVANTFYSSIFCSMND